MRCPRLPIAVLLVALAVSGCAGSDSGQADGGEDEPVATTRVDLPRSYRFAPERIRVWAGDEVTWTNSDQFTHNVVLLEPEERAVGTMRPGEKVSHSFEEAGTYRYECSLHPRDMRGEVLVE